VVLQGVLINGSSAAVDPAAATQSIGELFEIFWRWADPQRQATSVQVWSETYQATLTMPPWDSAVPVALRTASPLSAGLAPVHSAQQPQQLCDASSSSAAAADALSTPTEAAAFVSASPGGALSPGRTHDIDALLLTIRSATSRLSLNVMDFLPASGFSGGHGGAPVYWPALVDAILAVAYAQPVAVRLLVSKWAHTSSTQPPAMRRLADGLAACASAYQQCKGSFEVRQYVVPGWNLTTGATAPWPAYTRVNHQKYIVSDTRVNVGTSNWEWGYFHQTAGASYNTNETALVAAAQAVFDADWDSPYAQPCCD
jgi:phospholipase D3/4